MCSNRFARGPFYLHAQQFSGRVTDLVGTLQQARWIRPKYQNNAAVCPGWMVCSPLFCDLPFAIYPYWHRTSAAKRIGRFTYSPRDWQIRPGPLRAGRPTTLSGHMCRFPFYRKANEKFSAPWPRVHWAYVGVDTSLTISEPQARVWSFDGVPPVVFKPALVHFAPESSSCGIDEDAYGFGRPEFTISSRSSWMKDPRERSG